MIRAGLRASEVYERLEVFEFQRLTSAGRFRVSHYDRRSAFERSVANGDTASEARAGVGAIGGRRSRVPRIGASHPFASVSGTNWGSTHIASITRRCRGVITCNGSTLK